MDPFSLCSGFCQGVEREIFNLLHLFLTALKLTLYISIYTAGLYDLSRVQTRSVEVKEKPEMGSPFFRSNTGDS